MKYKHVIILITGTWFIVLLCQSCHSRYTPKPRGYYRVDFPEKKYEPYNGPCPYTFEYPVYGIVEKDDEPGSEPCWLNISFPAYKGKLHLSYKKVEGNLDQLLEDAYTLAYKHTVKADAIDEQLILKPETKVYGTLYNIRGNAASSVQFFLTDSTRNFIRGALYFRTQINKDSLAPVIRFFRQDVIHFIDTFEWKSSNQKGQN